MNKVIGLLIIVLTLTLVVITQPDRLLFADLYGLLFVIGNVFGYLIFAYGNRMFSIFRFLKQPVKSQRDYFVAVSFFDNMANGAIIAGVIGMLIGQIGILNNIDSSLSLLPATAVNSLTLLYGFIFAKFLFEPFKQSIVSQARLTNINPQVRQHIADNNQLAKQFIWLGILVIAATVAIHWLLLNVDIMAG